MSYHKDCTIFDLGIFSFNPQMLLEYLMVIFQNIVVAAFNIMETIKTHEKNDKFITATWKMKF